MMIHAQGLRARPCARAGAASRSPPPQTRRSLLLCRSSAPSSSSSAAGGPGRERPGRGGDASAAAASSSSSGPEGVLLPGARPRMMMQRPAAASLDVAVSTAAAPSATTAAAALQQQQQQHSSRQQRAAAASSSSSSSSSSSATLNVGGGSDSLSQSQAVLRVAVDVDEVLGRFVYALNQYCKDVHAMDYDVEDYWVYEFAKIWDCTQERSNHIVHSFFASEHFRKGIPVVPGARQALERVARSGADLVVVTSRQHVIQDATLAWLDDHYPGLFRDVYFGNHFAMSGRSRPKSDICRAAGAHVLIDDNPGYAVDCARAGLHVLLYDWAGGYPWAKLTAEQAAEHPNVTVVRDWAEAEAALGALAPLVREGAPPAGREASDEVRRTVDEVRRQTASASSSSSSDGGEAARAA